MRSLLPFVLSSFALAGCASLPPQIVTRTQTVTVSVPSFVPLDPLLTAAVPVPVLTAPITNGSLLRYALGMQGALAQANDQLSSIRSVQPPNHNANVRP